MRRASQIPSPANSPSPPPRPSRVLTQRQYREREGECFAILRDIIKQLTGEELQTRQEILRKVIDLLSSDLETRRQGQLQAVPSTSYDVPVVTDPTDMTSAHLGYSASSSQWPQTWQNPGLDGYYNVQTYGRQYYSMSQMDAGLDQAGYNEFGENWSNDHQL